MSKTTSKYKNTTFSYDSKDMLVLAEALRKAFVSVGAPPARFDWLTYNDVKHGRV